MEKLSQFWFRFQGTLLPFLRTELDPISGKQEKLIACLEIARIEDFVKNVHAYLKSVPIRSDLLYTI